MTPQGRKQAAAVGSGASALDGTGREAVARRLLQLLDPDFFSHSAPSGPGDPPARRNVRAAEREEISSPDVVGATVLLGFELGARTELLERIETEAPVIVVTVPGADWIDPMAKAATGCFGARASRTRARPREHGAGHDPDSGPAGAVVVAARGGLGPHSGGGCSKTASAFWHHQALIGIATPSGTGLPPDLLRACEERVAVGNFEPEAIALVVEHVTGSRPDRQMPGDIAAAVEPTDLRVGIHRARGADGSIDRLAAVVRTKLGVRVRQAGPRLRDLAGYGEAGEWGMAAAADLAAYGRGELLWSCCEPGVLLFGPPGTGKTLFASALANEAGVPLLTGSLAQWQAAGEAHLGTTLKAMRQFFETAMCTAPCIALLDELDSFGNRQRFPDHNRNYSTQVVNGLLECLDGEGRRPGVVLVGTTNNADSIDPAILRSGRFDRSIAVPLPSTSDLEAILRHYLGDSIANKHLSEAARRASGGTGADCAAWARRARGRARHAGRALEPADLLREIDGSFSSAETEQDWRIAIHESGHAVVAHALGMKTEQIVLRSPGHRNAGFTLLRMSSEFTRSVVHDILAVHLAGREAEILVLGEPSVGAGTDLAYATDICTDMHCRWGLGERIAACDPTMHVRKVRTSVERDLRRASQRALEILSQHRTSLDRLARALMEQRSLDGDVVAAMIE